MPENKQKLQIFTDKIVSDAREKAEKIEAKVMASEARILAEYEAQLSAELEKRTVIGATEAQAREEKRIAAGRLKNRRRLMEYREACVSEIRTALTARVRACTASDEYPEILRALLEKALFSVPGRGHYTVYLAEDDFRHVEYLESFSWGASLRFAIGSFSLGGLILVAGEPSVRRVDLSFDSAFDDLTGSLSELTGFDVEESHGV